MAERNFLNLLKERWNKGHFLCVGLDSDLLKIPESVRRSSAEQTIFSFNQRIIEATADLVCAFKPQIAFYEAHGPAGISALIRTTRFIREYAPDIPIILDAKRADVENTNKSYVRAAFDIYGVDAITVHPYLGRKALEPFLSQKDKGIIVLVRTSNPGAGEIQDLQVNGKPLYQIIAHQVASEWNRNGNCAVVAGATYPDELRKIREIVGDMPILIPGIGAQGGDVEKDIKETVKAGINSQGQGMIINSSRGIIFASSGPDFADAARRAVEDLDAQIKRQIKQLHP